MHQNHQNANMKWYTTICFRGTKGLTWIDKNLREYVYENLHISKVMYYESTLLLAWASWKNIIICCYEKMWVCKLNGLNKSAKSANFSRPVVNKLQWYTQYILLISSWLIGDVLHPWSVMSLISNYMKSSCQQWTEGSTSISWH